MAKDELVYSVDLEWDKIGFTSLNASIEKSIQAFTIVTAAVTAASAAVFSMSKNYAESTDVLLKTSQQVNATTQDIQKLTFAAEDNGSSMSDVTSSLESLSKAKEQMLRGSGDFEAWGRLGVNPTEYSNTADLLMDIADRVKYLDSQEAIDLMSRVGISPTMLQTLQNGKQGLRDLGLEAEALGMISTNKMVKSSQDFMSGWQRASSRVKGILDQISSSALDNTINPAIKSFNEFMSKNMVQISKSLNNIIDAISKASQIIFSVFHNVYIQFERINNLLGGTSNSIKAIAALLLIVNRNLVISLLPAILTVGALYIALDEVLSYLEGKDSFIGDFINNFPVLSTVIATTTTAIATLGVVSKISTASILAAKIAMTAFNFAVSANPIGIAVVAIGALTGAMYGFFTQTEIGKNIWTDFMGLIDDAIDMFKTLGDIINEALTFNLPSFDSIIGSAKSTLGIGTQPQAIAQTTSNNQISINVNGAGDPVAVSQEVRRVFNEEMNKSAMRGGF
jgi:hypothetical protein